VILAHLALPNQGEREGELPARFALGFEFEAHSVDLDDVAQDANESMARVSRPSLAKVLAGHLI